MSYEKLEERFRVTGGLRHGLAMLFWDTQTKMPSGGGTARSEAIAAQEMMIHRHPDGARSGRTARISHRTESMGVGQHG